MHVAIYDTQGRRVAGDGPAVGDVAVHRALRGRVTDVHDEGVVIVAVPVTSNKQVVAVARAASSPGEVRGRTLGAWAAMTGLALLAGIVASFIAAVQARRLTRPLQHLEAVAEDLGAGDFSTRAEPSGVGEIDRTGQALNVTAQRLDDLLARERAFTAQASHQLRTPLTSLRLGLESALQNDGDLRAAAHEAILSADQLSQTVDDVLALTRGTSTGTTPLDLTALLAEVRSRWETPLSLAGRTLVVIEETPPTAAAAEPAVRQILEVLLDNAFRHGKGTVTVTARDGGGALAIDVVDEGHVEGARPLVPVQDEQTIAATRGRTPDGPADGVVARPGDRGPAAARAHRTADPDDAAARRHAATDLTGLSPCARGDDRPGLPQVGDRSRREDQRRPRRPGEVELAEQVTENRRVLAYVGARVRPAVVGRVEALAAQEPVLDERGVRVEAERLVVDVPGPRPRADQQPRHPQAVALLVHGGRCDVVVEAAPVVPGEEDRRRGPVGALHHVVDQPGDVRLPVADLRRRVLAHCYRRDHPAHVREVPGRGRRAGSATPR